MRPDDRNTDATPGPEEPVLLATKPARVDSYYQKPMAGLTRHTAMVPLNPNPSRPFDFEQLAAVVDALRAADVPSRATIQFSYGSAVTAHWSEPDA